MQRQNLITWLRRGVFGLLFMTPLTVLLVSNAFFFPYITTKAFFFRTIVEVAFALWLLLVYLDRQYVPRWRSPLFIALSLFIGIIALSDILGVNFHRSFWSNFERMEGLVALLHIWVYFIVLVSMLRTKTAWLKFWHVNFGASVLVGLYGLMQIVGTLATTQGARLDATLGNAAYLGTYMFFNIFLTLYLWLQSKKTLWSTVGYWSAILLQFLILYKTATRGALLGLLAGVIMIGILFVAAAIFKKVPAKTGKIAGGLLAGSLLLVGGFIAFRDTALIQGSPVLKRFADISFTETTTRSRFMIWNMALEGFKERPILGWGQENFRVVFAKYYNPAMYDQEPWFDRTHNIVLDWLVAGGILGVVGYLSLYVVAGVLIWRTDSFSVYDRGILTGLLVGYFIQNLVIFDNITSYLLFVGLLAFIASEQTKTKASMSQKNSALSVTPLFYVVVIGVALVFVVVFYVGIVKPVVANTSIIAATRAEAKGDVSLSLEKYKTAIGQNTFGSTEVVEHMANATGRVLTSEAVPVASKTAWVQETRKSFDEAVEATGDDARTLVLYGAFLRAIGERELAYRVFNEALVLSPKKQQILFVKGATLVDEQKFTDALMVFKEAFELAPEFSEARKMYVLTAYYARNISLYNELIIPLLNEAGAVNDDRFVNIYAERREFSKLISIWTERVADYPANFEYRMRLAGSYYGGGNRAKAVEVLEQAITDFPAQRASLEAYIEAVRTGRAQIQ